MNKFNHNIINVNSNGHTIVQILISTNVSNMLKLLNDFKNKFNDHLKITK